MFSSITELSVSSRSPYSAQIGRSASNTASLMVPGRVTSSNLIPQGSMSTPIDPALLKGNPQIVQLSVKANNYETLELEDTSKNVLDNKMHWTRAIRLSDDCHNYNVQLRLLPSQRLSNILNKSVSVPKIILQAVRPIEPGQELLLWFSEDILAMLQMAFLTPANIQGQKKYVCTRCSTLYEYPNPLKLHITLCCERYSITSLWEKLANVLMEDQTPLKTNFKIFVDPPLSNQKTAIDLSLTQTPQSISPKETKCEIPVETKIYRPFLDTDRNSAFRPFQKNDENRISSNQNFGILQQPPVQQPMMVWPNSQDIYLLNERPQHVQRLDNEAHIETLVSSLGKSKQGHICLYCGKCYSRKYGLKIHIRTHTGYKPLKCKYCLRPFGDPSNLNKHVRLHAEGETPYKCDLCGKVLVRRRDLERHIKSRHMGEVNSVTNIEEETDLNEASLSEEDNSTIEV